MRVTSPLVVFSAVASLLLIGCASRATSSSEAIQHSKTLHSAKQQSSYLITQAKDFLSAKDYQEAVTTAQYLLASIDINSESAKEILVQAKQRLARDTQAVVHGDSPSRGL